MAGVSDAHAQCGSRSGTSRRSELTCRTAHVPSSHGIARTSPTSNLVADLGENGNSRLLMSPSRRSQVRVLAHRRVERNAARAGVSTETCRSATRLRRLGRRQERIRPASPPMDSYAPGPGVADLPGAGRQLSLKVVRAVSRGLIVWTNVIDGRNPAAAVAPAHRPSAELVSADIPDGMVTA